MSEEKTTESARRYPPAAELWQIPGIAAALAVFAVAAYVARHPMEGPSPRNNDFAALELAYQTGDTIVSAGSAERYLARYASAGSREDTVARFILADSKWDLTRSNPATTNRDLVECLTAYRRALIPGLSPEYEARALEGEGEILLRLGQYGAALDSFTLLLERHPQRRDALMQMALVYAHMNPPDMARADESIDDYLATEGLDAGRIQDAYIVKAELALDAADNAGAETAAMRVIDAGAAGERSAHALVLAARALLAEGRPADAIALIDAHQVADAGRYEPGLALIRATAVWKGGDASDARKAIDETIFRFPGTSEALTARYQLGRLLFDSGELDAARDALVSLLDDMSAQQSTGTDAFTINDVTDLWFAVGRSILENKDYAAVRDYHSAATALMTEGRFLFFDATLSLAEAEREEARVATLPPAEARAAAGTVKVLYAEAGETFAKVLETSSGDIYTQALYNAGHSLYMAGRYVSALHYLRMYSDESFYSDKTPQVLYEQAQCLSALGSFAPAIAVCRTNAKANPTNIYGYRSILLQADLYRGMGGENTKYAAAVYGDILTDARFQARSVEWRRAIFALGETLYDLGSYRDAVLRLDEALTRFPGDGEAPRARWYLASALRQGAFEDAGASSEFLARAADIFGQIARSGGSEDWQRNAAFDEADCYYCMGDYQKALSLYGRAVEANVDTPEATRGLFQIANCYHRLGAVEQADATYKRALFSLRRAGRAPAPGGEFYEAIETLRTAEDVEG